AGLQIIKRKRLRETALAIYLASTDRRSAPQSYGGLRQRLQRVERDRLNAPPDRRLVQDMAAKVEVGSTRGILRQDEFAVVILGQALKPRRGVHGVADRCDDLRAWRPHRADDG